MARSARMLRRRQPSSAPTVRTNLALNPRALTGGATSWQNEGAGTWTVAYVTSGLPTHPLGITSARRSNVTSNATNLNAMALYNIDGLGDSATSRHAGVWVYCTASGFQVRTDANSSFPATALTVDTWTWVTSVTPDTSYLGLYVGRVDLANAANTVMVYATGLMVETGGVVGAFFDGATANGGGKTYAWTGAANASSSTETTA